MRGGREAILKAAMTVFARKGFVGASMREICLEAGITKPALYYHFRSKEHLFQELVIDTFGHLRKVMLGAAQDRGPLRERLVRIVYEELRLASEKPALVRFILRMVFAPEEQADFNYIDEMERRREAIAAVIQQGIDRGEARGSAYALAGHLLGLQLNAVLEAILAGRPTLTRRRARECVDLLLGVRADE